MRELIITEKPQQSQKIAEALSEGKAKKVSSGGVSYFEFKIGDKQIIVASAVGHLFILSEKKKSAWTYPIFDIEWKPSYTIAKNSKFTKKYYDLLKKLSNLADTFTVATDFDLEGSVIGANVVRYICGKKDANRMKFSTLTKDELKESYKNKMSHLDIEQVNAGETRHFMDFFYGINISRALTLSIKNATNRFKIMSSGRVQGPALKLIVDKEKDIEKFIPQTYYQLFLFAKKDKKEIKAVHKEDKIFDKKRAEELYNKTKSKDAYISKISTKEFEQTPPHPFDLTAMQIEAYRTIRVSPKETLSLSQNLYLGGFISYPRTSSNILPESLDYKKILSSLEAQGEYKDLAKKLLLSKKLKPNNGKKVDLAHPAIYPTGEIPTKLTEKEKKLYDLIVRRTLATFAPNAKKQSQNVEIEVNKEIFLTSGQTTIEKGWYEYYGKYTPYTDKELPHLTKDEKLNYEEIKLIEDQTKPPKRYTQSSIIRELEKRNLGTKATRATIIDTLYQRNYIEDEPVKATKLGIQTISTLGKFSPEIIDEELTRHFEHEMDQIQENKKDKEEVLQEAKEVLTKIFKTFKKNELEIGKELLDANTQTQDISSIIGKCNICNDGNLKIMYSKKNKQYFIACSNYPQCKNTFSVPKYALIKPANKKCEVCNFPKILVIRKGKRPYEFCINKECQSKKEQSKELDK